MDSGLQYKFSGLDTGLKPTFGLKISNNRYDTLEGLLEAIERDLFNEAFQIHYHKLNQ